MSPDGNTLAVLTASGDLRLFDTGTWRPRGQPLVRRIPSPGWLRFDPSGTQLAYTDGQGTHLVDVRTGTRVGPTFGTDPGSRVVFSSDGNFVGVDAGIQDSVFRVFDRRTGAQLAQIPAATGDLRPGADEVAVMLPNGQTALQRYRRDGTSVGRPVPLPGASVGEDWVRYTPDGRRLLVTNADGVTDVLDADTLTPVGRPIGGSGTRLGSGANAVVGAEIDPRGDLVVLALDGGSVLVASTADGSLRATIGGLGQGPVVTFLDDHRFLASTLVRTAEYDLGQATPLGSTTSLPDPISRLLAEPRGEWALLGQGQQLVEVDRDGKPLPTDVRLPLETEGPMALSPDGRRIAALGYPPGYHLAGPDPGLPEVPNQKGNLVIADRTTGTVLVRATVAGDEGAPEEGGMAFSPDGRRLAVGTWGGVLTMLDSATGRVLAERRTDSSALRALRWSRDGTVLYEGGGDGVLRFLDPATLKTETAVPLTASGNFALNAVVPVPRTRLLAVAGDTGQVFFVDAGRRTVVGQPLAAQGAQLLAVALSPDGTVVAGVGWDGALRLWDVASGRAIGPPLEAHDGYTRSIAWLDPDHLLTASFDGRLIAWDMAPSDWVARACALAGRDLTRAEWARYLPGQSYRRTCEQQ